MRRWPFGLAALLLFAFNGWRLGGDINLRVWNDPVCAIFFAGYLICCAIDVSIRTTPAPPAD